MPGEDGLSIARYLREHFSIGIIILTATGQTLDRIIGLEIGADDYMGKPFDLRELLARVKSVLRRVTACSVASRPRSRRTKVKIGRLTLNSVAHKLVDEKGEEIQLTSMEYDSAACLRGPCQSRVEPRPAARSDAQPEQRPVRPQHRRPHSAAEAKIEKRSVQAPDAENSPRRRLHVRARRRRVNNGMGL